MNIIILLLLLIINCDFSQAASKKSLYKSCISLLSRAVNHSSRSFNEQDLQKFENFQVYHDLKGHTGIEFEGMIPEDIQYLDIASMIKSKIVKKYDILPDDISITGGLNAWEGYYSDNQLIKILYPLEYEEKIIKIELEDFRPPFGFHPIEISSQVLKEESDHSLFFDILQNMKSMGVKSWELNAGLHIHVDATGLTFEELYLILKLISLLDKDIRTTFKVEPMRSGLEIIPPEYLEKLSQRSGVITEKDLPFLKKQPQIVRWSSYKTIEFRLFNSTLDTKLIKQYQTFSQNLVSAIRSKNPLLLRYFENSSPYKTQEIIEILHSEVPKL